MQTMTYDWVIARHRATSDQGKYVLSLASMGIGYFLINKERVKSEDIIVAFKFATNRKLPQHLQYATSHQSQKLDELEKKRRSPTG